MLPKIPGAIQLKCSDGFDSSCHLPHVGASLLRIGKRSSVRNRPIVIRTRVWKGRYLTMVFGLGYATTKLRLKLQHLAAALFAMTLTLLFLQHT